MNGGLNILIVEDSELIREKVNTLLSELDCISKIENSGDGNEALSMITANKPDVILLDINLPGKSGLSILKEIRLHPSNTTVVMLTNYSDEYYRSLCSRLGADHFLDKSTEFEKIPTLLSSIYRKAV